MFILIQFLAFLLVVGYAVYLFAHVVYSRYLFIRLGRKPEDQKGLKERWKALLINVFGQRKLLKDKRSGVMHVIFFYGFIILQFGAIDLILKGLIPGARLPIPFYGGFTLVQEMTTMAVLLAVAYGIYRRYIEKLPRLKRGWKAGMVYWFIGTLFLSVLAAGGMEMAMAGEVWNGMRPFSSLVAYLAQPLSPEVSRFFFYFFWWIHLLILLAFLVYVPQSKHAHLIAAPINVFLKRLSPPGRLTPIHLEDETAEEFGVGRIEQFTQKQLLDLYACVECGRCTSMCPANNTGKSLSPMQLIVKMRDHLTEKGAAVTGRTPWMPASLFAHTRGNRIAWAHSREGTQGEVAATKEASAEEELMPPFEEISLIGDVITEEEIWACTTCRNCEDQCPVMNEHVDKIIDLRRYLVLTEGRVSGEVNRTFQNIERQGNPWGLNRNDRSKWRDVEGIEAPTVKEKPDFEYLLFVGSMGSYDRRSMKITQTLVKILNHAGVSFAILGNEEKNSGDTARRLGNEMLFQQLALENIENFRRYGVKKILTIDPHTFNTFKNEYPDFGFQGEVIHHTQLLYQLLKEGRIAPKVPVRERITYHDSCYLGRYNGMYDVPREILKAIPGVELVEMKRNRQDSMCCGAGGGLMWMEEKEGTRVNLARTEQALEVSPTLIGTACPYCLTMISDGVKMKEADVETLDVVEILAKSLQLEGEEERTA
ncbi:putative iron-sulphur-binding reductase [[Clostridium] ultunense Esp]|nr:putative iron-sulphur-binding reductase [[Clostridium] ultunense Esp]